MTAPRARTDASSRSDSRPSIAATAGERHCDAAHPQGLSRGTAHRLAAGQSRYRSRSTFAARVAAGPLLALAALLVAPLLGAGGLAYAQTSVLISNIGQMVSSSVTVPTFQSHGQGFTTGSASGEHTLGSVELAVSAFSGTASEITVSIYSESSGNPGTVVHTLTTPASISRPATTFTAPSGTTLAASTTYYVVITTTGTTIFLSSTDATAEDTGGASGWSIADDRRYTSSGTWTTTATPLRMRINGTAGTSTDATLSGLVLNDGTNDLTLTPTFATATTSYAASVGNDIVGNDIDRITVAPETTDDGATVAYLDENDAEIGDADGNTEGHQVALDVGANTIKVKVTAADDATTQTYTVVVTRQTQAQTGSWSATLIAGTFGNVVGCHLIFGGINPAMDCASSSVLSDDEFTHDGTTYTIQILQVTTNEGEASLLINVTPSWTNSAAELTLTVDGTPFAFNDGSGGGPSWSWSDTGLSWTVGQSVSLSLTASATTAPPTSPTSLSATANGETQIDLSWTAPADDGGSAITGYKIEWSADGSDPWAALRDDTESTDTTYADTGLTAGTTRHYRVSAINSMGAAGTASSVASTTTDVPVTVTVPDTLSVLENDTLVEIAVTATTGINAPPPRPFEIQLVTADGTAIAREDYLPLTLTLGFAVDDFSAKEIDGVFRWQATRLFLVSLSLPDAIIEDDETLTMTLIRPEGLSPSIVLGTPKTLTVTILNDDGIDATLSGLVLNDGTNDLTLAPTFATDTTSYTASVANDIDQITVTPETNDDSATVAYLDENDAEITDADGNTEGHQVALDVGANTIKVEVTAADDMTTQTYTLTVIRAEAPPPTPR